MGGLKKVKSGDRLRILAADYNALVDAANAHSAGLLADRAGGSGAAEPLSRQNTIILVRNDTGAARDRFAVVGIDGPIIHPDDNEAEFERQVVLKVVLPVYGLPPTGHDGREIVLAEPIADGAIGRAFVDGVCPVVLNVPSEAVGAKPLCAHNAAGYRMIPYSYGAHTILWREKEGDSPSTGLQWAVIRIGRSWGAFTFPMTLAQVGGSDGSATTAASWTYNCTDVLSGATLLSAVNPVSAPHVYKRPTIGKMGKATTAIAYENVQGQIVIQWCNEIPTVEACT